MNCSLKCLMVVVLVVSVYADTDGHTETAQQGHDHSGAARTNPMVLCRQILRRAGFEREEDCPDHAHCVHRDMTALANGKLEELAEQWAPELDKIYDVDMLAFDPEDEDTAAAIQVCEKRACFMPAFAAAITTSGVVPSACADRTHQEWGRIAGSWLHRVERDGADISPQMIKAFLCMSANKYARRH